MFGVTGDLARKKLSASDLRPGQPGLLPPGFSLVGFARRDWAGTRTSPGRAMNAVKAARAHPVHATHVWQQLSARASGSCQGDFDDDAAFDTAG